MNYRTPSHPAPPAGACQDSAPPIISNTGASLPDHFRSRMLLHSGYVAHVEVRIHPVRPSRSDAVANPASTEVTYA